MSPVPGVALVEPLCVEGVEVVSVVVVWVVELEFWLIEPLCEAEPADVAGWVQGWLLVLPVALPVAPPAGAALPAAGALAGGTFCVSFEAAPVCSVLVVVLVVFVWLAALLGVCVSVLDWLWACGGLLL